MGWYEIWSTFCLLLALSGLIAWVIVGTYSLLRLVNYLRSVRLRRWRSWAAAQAWSRRVSVSAEPPSNSPTSEEQLSLNAERHRRSLYGPENGG